MDNCIFCKISSGEIPSNTVYEDEQFRVILDAAPANPGHCLILPKKHAHGITELDEADVQAAFALARRVAAVQEKTLKPDGINILQNNGEAAGQSVFHFHIHVIPRYKSDGVTISSKAAALSDSEFKDIASKLSKAF